MEITLPADLEAYIEGCVRGGAFASAAEFIGEAVRRKMEDDASMEERVLEAEQTPLSPLTREDLKSVRRVIREAPAPRTA